MKLLKNAIFMDEMGNKKGVSLELHFVIKRILEVCDVWQIDFEKELKAKIDFNNSRPKDYRKIGNSELLETDFKTVRQEMLASGFGMYKEIAKVVEERRKINAEVLAKRESRVENETLKK